MLNHIIGMTTRRSDEQRVMCSRYWYICQTNTVVSTLCTVIASVAEFQQHISILPRAENKLTGLFDGYAFKNKLCTYFPPDLPHYPIEIHHDVFPIEIIATVSAPDLV